MGPQPVVIKLKPVQTRRLVAANTVKNEAIGQIPMESQCLTTVLVDNNRHQRQHILKENLARYDVKIAERTPIEELKAGKHQLPIWADGLFDITPAGQPRRRRKLNHLSQDEKVLRRKLKNRVAAQNARDKKKTEAETLKSENDQLRSLVEQLRKEQKQQQYDNEIIRSENILLRSRLGVKSESIPNSPSSTLDQLSKSDQNSTGFHSDSGSSPDVRVEHCQVRSTGFTSGLPVVPGIILRVGRT